MKRIVITVSNDLFSDRRVGRIASTLHKTGYSVTLIGRRVKNSPPVVRGYKTVRYRLLFNKSFLFYACLNFRLFFDLLFRKFDIVVANDLDTLPACHIAARLRSKKLVFDSHELFPEVPELQDRPFVKSIWQRIEKIFVKRQKHCYTVCNSIANYYKEKYGVHFEVIMNVPEKQNIETDRSQVPEFPHPLLIYQGALNKARGIEKIIFSMKYLQGFHFLVIGTGDIENELKELAEAKGLGDKVIFTGRISPQLLPLYTSQADIGISLEENIGLNYYYALPNKLFDYINAGVPVLVSSFPEMKRIVEEFNIGCHTTVSDPEKLAEIIFNIFNSENYNLWKQNTIVAARELNWDKESLKLLEIFNRI